MRLIILILVNKISSDAVFFV